MPPGSKTLNETGKKRSSSIISKWCTDVKKKVKGSHGEMEKKIEGLISIEYLELKNEKYKQIRKSLYEI